MSAQKTAVILIEQDFQDLEVWYPALRLREAGLKVIFAGTGSAPQYKGKFGYPAVPDTTIDKVGLKDFDVLIIPGGWAPDFLRRYPLVIQLVKDADKAGKIIGSICHGGWVLASADIIKGRAVTSFSAIKDDLVHAGANYQDAEVVVDRNLITSRKPDDLPAFCAAILKQVFNTVNA